MWLGWTLWIAAHAASPLDDCRATALAPATVLLSCGDETAWFSERPQGSLETVLVDFSNAWVRTAGSQMASSETRVTLGAASYRGYKVVFPGEGRRRSPEGVVLAAPWKEGIRAAACVSRSYGVTCERMLRSLLEEGLPPSLVLRSRSLWLDRPLLVPPGCDYGDMGDKGGGISCGEDLLVWVNTRNRTEAEQAIADTFHEFAAELQGHTGPSVPCTVGGTSHQCHTLVDSVGTRAWFTAVELDGKSAFQYCLSHRADHVAKVCQQVLSVP